MKLLRDRGAVLHAELDAYEDDLKVFSRTWKRIIPRDFV